MEDLQHMMDLYIDNGQVYHALKYALITKEDLLERLAKTSPSINHLIAYRHFLLQQKELGYDCPEQKLLSGQHFFTLAPHDYVLLYALMGFPLEIPDLPTGQVGLILTPITVKLYTDPGLAHFIQVITGYQKRVDSLDDIDLAIRARQFDTIFMILADTNHLYLEYDTLEPLFNSISQPVDWSFLDALIRHCSKIQEHQPELWVHLIDEYTSFLKRLHNKNYIRYFADLHPQLISLFPQLFPEEFNTMTPLAWKLYYLPPVEAGYYLGFPLNCRIPTQEDLLPAILDIAKLGIDGYCDKFIQENKKFMEARINVDLVWTLFKQYNTQFVNERDTLHEDVFGYSSYDLTILPDGNGRFFILTTPELPSFVQQQKNHWTNKPLPQSLIDTTKSYLHERKSLNLPPSQPIRDLLQHVNDNTLPGQRRNIERPRGRYQDDDDDIQEVTDDYPMHRRMREEGPGRRSPLVGMAVGGFGRGRTGIRRAHNSNT